MASTDADDHDALNWYAMQLSTLGSVPQLRALWYVHHHEPTTAAAVADHLDVLDDTARDKLRRLRRVGLVDKSRTANRVHYRTTARASTVLSTPPKELLATDR